MSCLCVVQVKLLKINLGPNLYFCGGEAILAFHTERTFKGGMNHLKLNHFAINIFERKPRR